MRIQILLYVALGVISLVVSQLNLLHVEGSILLACSAACIAFVGVPHGGLDHLHGRRLLQPLLADRWWLVFLPAYLFVGTVIAALWLAAPVPTIVSFLVLSAWHFGREEHASSSHLECMSLGGIVIWGIALARPIEMTEILASTIYSNSMLHATLVTDIARVLGLVLLPISVVILLWRVIARGPNRRNLGLFAAQLVTLAVAIWTPILVSFTLYFCFWHSVLGLRRLRRSEGLGRIEFIKMIAPLSLSAVGIVVVIGLGGMGISLADLGRVEALRLVFIGLASIAVPHIVLHELLPSLLQHRGIQRDASTRELLT